MVELLQDERKLIKKGDVVLFLHNQVQEYTEDARQNFLKDWNKEKTDKEQWLKNFDLTVEQAKQLAVEELERIKAEVVKDIERLDKMITLWSNPVIEDGYQNQSCS